MIEFKCDPKNLIDTLDMKGKQILSALKQGMRQGMSDFETNIIKFQMGGPKGPGSLAVGSGALRRSWHITTTDYGSYDFVVRCATDSKYAAIHQFGGTITPKNSKYLTIPIHPDAKNHFAGQFPDLFFFMSRSGNAFLARTKLAGSKKDIGSMQLMFLLKKSVTIPKRLHIIEQWNQLGFKTVGWAMKRNLQEKVGLQ